MRIWAYFMRYFIKAIKAISDETRLRILNLLLERECCVCEIMQALDITQTRASRNLGILHDAGFLKMRREGSWTYYSIKPMALEEYYADLMKMIKDYLADNNVIIADLERLKKARQLNRKCQ